MSLLLSLTTNDLKLFPLALSHASNAVRHADSVSVGWAGVATYQDGRAVLKRRPLDETVRLSTLLEDIKTKRILAHVQDRPETSYDANNTQPFRYKNWLFALSGTLGGGGLDSKRTLELIPDYLRQNIQGNLPPELVFHLFLANLYDEARLPVQRMESERIASALARTVRALPDLVEQRGDIEFSLLLSNGAHVFGATHGRPLWYRTIEGLTVKTEQGHRVERYDWLRAAFVCNFVPDGEEARWQALEPEHLLLCDESFALTTVPIA
jgi:glutamine amidotransferase